jgi:hypothetical protein
MGDSALNDPERPWQQIFSFPFLFSCLLILGAIFGTVASWRGQPDRPAQPPRSVALQFSSIALPRGSAIAGAWRMRADDPRFGGISGAAFDSGRLIAVTDSGVLLTLDLPGSRAPRVALRDLPAVAGRPDFKLGRDSEALLRDPLERGWWVAFEQRHSLLLFDPGFTRLLRRVPLSSPRFADNRGIEALYAEDRGTLVALPESSGYSDAARLPDGRVALLERGFSWTGLRSAVRIGKARIALPLRAIDNPEAIAVQPRADGGTRLWIMTDNNLDPRQRSLLLAIDLARER